MRFFLCLFLLCCSLSSQASPLQINAIISQYSAAEFAAGVAHFHANHPQVRIQARTPEQLAEWDETALQQWLQQGAVVLGVGLFGPETERLQRALRQSGTQDRFIFHSDLQLVQLSRVKGQPLFGHPEQAQALGRAKPKGALAAWVAQLKAEHPQQADWIEARSYWLAGGSDNIARLLGWLAWRLEAVDEVQAPLPRAALRFYQDGTERQSSQLQWQKGPLVAVLDHQRADRSGDRELNELLCQQVQAQGFNCVSLLASWGQGTLEALQWLEKGAHPPVVALMSLQDFVLGGGELRAQATAVLERLNIPVFKGLRLDSYDATEWMLSSDGLPRDKVHYQLAMPELQGISQPWVLAEWQDAATDPHSGIRYGLSRPLPSRVAAWVRRLQRWVHLQQADNADKRLAIIYYNHPPGRHNIGADNLDVPQSLLAILRRLQAEGYETGPLPADAEALLALLQAKGVNLPEQNDALARMAGQVAGLETADYQRWFETLPQRLQAELQQGPLGLWHSRLRQAIEASKPALAERLLEQGRSELHHVLDGVQHPARTRALALLEQLETLYRQALERPAQADWDAAWQRVEALAATGIEGLRGWGPPPGRIMVHEGRMLFPGLRFGKVFVGPQPPRGWEVDEELLHANLVFPPPHQYLGFYHWLRDEFQADALIHLGRHSTYEFLPHRRAGLTDDDYPLQVVGDLPSLYPYIVDGVGEGIQAKRRGLAVMIDHLTPPLATTPLYDDLLRLRQLVESFESGSGQVPGPARQATLAEIRRLIVDSGLEADLRASMADPLRVRGQDFAQADDDLLVHEVGHYLTHLQERFMPLGLHAFGVPWSPEAIDIQLTSMGSQAARSVLQGSPAAELKALMAGLSGRFIAPGKGNDPVRTPEALPTGRNFHALDSSLLPSQVAWAVGQQLAQQARLRPLAPEDKEAVILWASDTVRDEGAMIAFALDLLGLEPQWNSRGIVQGLKRRALAEGEQRRDLLFTTSGLFRDLYADQLALLDRGVRLALAAASHTIRRDYPALQVALAAALAPLGEAAQEGGQESLAQNQVAAHWVAEARTALDQGQTPERAGKEAALRLFGVAPGAYGAGINRLVERSGAWQERSELARSYIQRMGHAYGLEADGKPAQSLFRNQLRHVQHTYLGRSSNLYGLMDNNDAFDYLGGLSLAVEQVRGQPPENFVSWHNDPQNAHLQSLQSALLGELRGRFLNPAWLQALMQHDYAGARTMGSEFMEYLWGWQVTNPDIITSQAWEAVKAVYIDDSHELGLAEFLEQGANVHVKSNMLAIMLVAIQKGFWPADAETRQALGEAFARLVSEHGLPGSGHTRPDHPMLDWLQPQLPDALQKALAQRRAAAQGPVIEPEESSPSHIQELQEVTPKATDVDLSDPHHAPQREENTSAEGDALSVPTPWLVGSILLLLLLLGFWQGRQGGRH